MDFRETIQDATKATDAPPEAKKRFKLGVPASASFNRETFVFRPSHTYIWGISVFIMVGNVYYNQPLLVQLANDFQVSESRIGLVPTLTQAGYAVGMVVLVPLGDLVRRRQLINATIALCMIFTALMAGGFNAVLFEVLSLFVGILTVSPQILMPLAADLCPPERRGSTLGVIQGCLALGILCSRMFAGIVANFFPWRWVYIIAVILMLGLLIVLYFLLPDVPPTITDGLPGYPKLMLSLVELMLTEPVLVQSCGCQFFQKATFAIFWTVLTFLLSDVPFQYSTFVIGLFAVVGIAGTLAAPLAGRLIDKHGPYLGVTLGILATTVGWCILLGLGGNYVAAIAVGGFLSDFGGQMSQVANQTRIFARKPTARSRLNALYMTCSFAGSALGAGTGTAVYARFGWRGTCVLAIGYLLLAGLFQAVRGPRAAGTQWFGWRAPVAVDAKATADEEVSIPPVDKDTASIMTPDAEKSPVTDTRTEARTYSPPVSRTRDFVSKWFKPST
ncbi:hypothetical protein SmJEL517_g06206 [Synchytrium microbalum]|uniref:Major facilitator superfamily (MFS) profile domain-containing protein n=1 Tax=Synchytrium microbalum TaxID=1806994 RepID=A0A507BWE7_9FUNG|nr:uncharacterized protein SmJEL517_g06206 [Synchytrium microbalum]TPX30164.1 hypothetical protein SmJEL517_g06206 [Synchytrium microbalum]